MLFSITIAFSYHPSPAPPPSIPTPTPMAPRRHTGRGPNKKGGREPETLISDREPPLLPLQKLRPGLYTLEDDGEHSRRSTASNKSQDGDPHRYLSYNDIILVRQPLLHPSPKPPLPQFFKKPTTSKKKLPKLQTPTKKFSFSPAISSGVSAFWFQTAERGKIL